MEKIISINGKQVGFKATARTPSRYRKKFNRDLIKEFRHLNAKYEEAKNDPSVELSGEDLEIFERMAYIMAWQYDNTIPNSPDDWLDQFDMFDIYEILDQITELMVHNETELEKPKKKAEEQSEN